MICMVGMKFFRLILSPGGKIWRGKQLAFDDKCLPVTIYLRRNKVAYKAVFSSGGRNQTNMDTLTGTFFPLSDSFPRGKKVPKIRQFFPPGERIA